MKRINFSLITFIFSAVIFLGCTPKKETSNHRTNDIQVIDTIIILQDYPEIEDYDRYVVSVPQKKDETHYRVEIIPGIMMEVDDCNDYGLQGDFEEQTNNKTNTTYYVYKTDGEVVKTLIACASDSMHIDFVSGARLLKNYNSAQPTIVYYPKGVEIQYTIWKVSDMIPVEKDAENMQFDFLPIRMDRYIFQPETTASTSLIELIPGIVKKVDCNNHRLISNGFMYSADSKFENSYIVFNSDGNIVSTRKGCPNKIFTEKFIFGDTEKISTKNVTLPIKILIPNGFILKYRIWEKITIDS